MSQVDESTTVIGALGRNLRRPTHDQFPDRDSLDTTDTEFHFTKPVALLVEEAIRSRVPFAAGSYDESDRDTLMSDFASSMAVIREAVEDVKELARRLWPLNVAKE